MRTLRSGSKGKAVRELQRLLNARLRIHLKTDGDFRDETEKAVKRFQGMNGLAIDGIVGPETWAVLQAPVKPPVQPDDPGPDPTPPQKPAQGHKGAFAILGLVVAFALSWLFWGP